MPPARNRRPVLEKKFVPGIPVKLALYISTAWQTFFHASCSTENHSLSGRFLQQLGEPRDRMAISAAKSYPGFGEGRAMPKIEVKWQNGAGDFSFLSSCKKQSVPP